MDNMMSKQEVLKVLDDEAASLLHIDAIMGLEGFAVDSTEAIRRLKLARDTVAAWKVEPNVCKSCGMPNRDSGLSPIEMCACATLTYNPTRINDDLP